MGRSFLGVRCFPAHPVDFCLIDGNVDALPGLELGIRSSFRDRRFVFCPLFVESRPATECSAATIGLENLRRENRGTDSLRQVVLHDGVGVTNCSQRSTTRSQHHHQIQMGRITITLARLTIPKLFMKVIVREETALLRKPNNGLRRFIPCIETMTTSKWLFLSSRVPGVVK